MKNSLMYLLILTVTNFFGVFNVLEELRIPGVGKPSDIILAIMNLILLLKLLNNWNFINKSEKKFVNLTIILILYIFFLIIYSSLITKKESFVFAFRTGGSYLYYSSFLFPIAVANGRKQLNHFINFLRIGGFLTGVIAIVSNVIGHSIVTGALSQVEGHSVRVYLPAFFNYFVVIFGLIQIITKGKYEIKINYLEIIVNIFGIILFLGRTRIVVFAMMILFVVLLSARVPSKNRRRVFYLALVLISGIVFYTMFFDSSISDFFNRFHSGYVDSLQGTSTLSFRFYLMSLGFQTFSQTPLFGTGFIHPSSNFYSKLISLEGYSTTSSGDFGLPSILFTTGIVGIVLITYFIIVILRYIVQNINLMKERKQFNTLYNYSFTVFTIVIFVYFIEQIAGNEFGTSIVAIYLIPLGFAVKHLSIANWRDEFND